MIVMLDLVNIANESHIAIRRHPIVYPNMGKQKCAVILFYSHAQAIQYVGDFILQ